MVIGEAELLTERGIHMSKFSLASKRIGRLVAIFALGLGMVAPFALSASPASAAPTVYTATSTDGTVFSASSLQDAQIEAASYNMTQAQNVAPGKVVTFDGFNQSVCLQSGEQYNGDFTTWNAAGALAGGSSNCSYNPKPPKTIFCYKGAKLVKAVVAVNPKCPVGYTKNKKK